MKRQFIGVTLASALLFVLSIILTVLECHAECTQLNTNANYQKTQELVRGLYQRMKNNSYAQYNKLDMGHYYRTQDGFVVNLYNGSYSMKNVVLMNDSYVLGQVALTNKSFYKYSPFSVLQGNSLIYGYYQNDDQYMEYLVILGKLL